MGNPDDARVVLVVLALLACCLAALNEAGCAGQIGAFVSLLGGQKERPLAIEWIGGQGDGGWRLGKTLASSILACRLVAGTGPSKRPEERRK